MSLFRVLSFVVLLMLLWVTEVSAATYSLIPPNQRPAICSGTQGTWSGNVYVCNWGQPFSVASGDTITSNTNIRILSYSGFNLTNVTLGGSSYTIDLEAQGNNETRLTGSTLYGSIYGSSNNVRLQSGAVVQGVVNVTGSFQSANSTVGGNVSANNGITAVDSTFYANLTSSNSSINLTRGVVYNNVTVTAQTLTATGTIFNGNILSTSGNITLTDANVAGNVSAPSNAITATNTDITGTVTANGNIVLTNVEVDGKVTSTSNVVSGTGTVFGNGISGGSGILVSGGSITGDLRSSCNNIVLTSTTMTSGTIQTTPTLGSGCASDKVEFNNSTVNATILGGPNNVYVKDSQFTGDIKARFNVELENSTVYGNILGEPGFILHTVDLDDSFVYGNVTVRNDYGRITGNWPDSAIYGDCSYYTVTPSLCSSAQAPAADAYWKFDEAQWTGASNQVLDSSVNLRHGTARNGAITAVLDPSPASCTFGTFQRGSSSSNNPHVYVERNAYFHNADDFGFTLWLKMNASQQYGSRQVILAYGDEDGVDEEDEGRFELLRTSQGRLRFAVRMQSEALRYVEVTGTSIFDGQWKHIAVSYSKQNKRLRLYLNNVLVSDTPNASIGNGNNDRTPNDGNTGLSIGALPEGDDGIRGQIDEVKFFAHEPTAAEIQAMYQQTASCANECFNENFTSDTNWYLTQRNSTPPSLRTSPSRLRLTENTLNQSTSITFKRSFPAAGNKMTIEFDHYAYGGTGADGIALVLSDASITPVPGSYGGSLGYAQRTNVSPSQSGFAGGWLGIGFDEYGSFSQATEGRVGGTTARPNAIGVRAASSTSYGWLGGTTTLSPALSASGNSLARGDRYRITIDSTASSSTAVAFQLERRLAGGTTYSTLLTSSNLLALGQPVPPANLLLSYTGSTGDNTNFHEITNIQVCTQKPSTPIEFGNQLHHIEFSYPASPLTCNPTEVTIKACANAACTELYTSPVTLTLAATGGSWSGSNPFTFTGSTTKNLSKTTAGNFTVAVSSSSVTPQNAVQCKQNGLTDDCTFAVADSGFVFDVQDMVANQPQSVVISAVRKDNSSQQCVPGFKDVTRPIKFWSDYIDPNAAGRPESRAVLVNSAAIAQNLSSAVTQNLSFNSNGQATLALNYTDAGQMQLNARYDGSTSTGDNGLLMTGSDQFIARPAGICIQEGNGSTAPVSCTSPYSNCTAFKKAGESFNLSVIAKASANNGDTNICANPISTPNFKLNAIALSRTLIAPLVADGANPGVLGVQSYNHVQSAGGIVTTAQTVSEVGVYTFTATPVANSYFGYSIAPATSAPVGRFIPAYFTAAVNAPVLAACNSATVDPAVAKFAYLGQPLGYQVFPRATLTAKNVQNQTTLNYGLSFFKAQSMVATTATAMQSAANYSTLSAVATPSAVSRGKLETANFDAYDGQFDLTMSNVTASPASAEQISFARTLPYSPPILSSALGLTLNLADGFVKDSDGVCVKTADNTACLPVTFSSITAPELRYGRMRLSGGSAPESHPTNPVSIPVSLSAEYWNGSAFVVNTADNCSVVDFANLSLESGLGKSGVAGQLTAGLSGANSLLVQIPANTLGTWPVFYQAPNWLKFDWLKEPQGQPLVLEDPSAEVSVGRFRGNKRQIFWQEKLN